MLLFCGMSGTPTPTVVTANLRAIDNRPYMRDVEDAIPYPSCFMADEEQDKRGVEMPKNKAALRQWGKRLLLSGGFLLLIALVVLMFSNPLAAFWLLAVSTLVNAAGAYLLLFNKKDK